MKTKKLKYIMYVNNIHMDAKNIQFTEIELKIAKYIFRHYRDRYNPRQLAKLMDINHAHANKLCNSLADKDILTKERIGNAAYFRYNYNNKSAMKFMEYLLSIEEKEAPQWLEVPLYSLKKLKPYLQAGLIFGSSVKMKSFNDIDVILIYKKEEKNNVARMKDEIRKSGLVEKPIKYVEISKEDIVKNKDDNIFYSILSESMVFHNAEKYVEVIKKCLK